MKTRHDEDPPRDSGFFPIVDAAGIDRRASQLLEASAELVRRGLAELEAINQQERGSA